MKKMLFLMVALLTSVGIWAVDFEVDGIYYYVMSEENHTVQVTGYNSSYDGDLILNGTVSYNNITYNVVSIGYHAFYNCTSLTSIGDLSACTSIGQKTFYYCTSLTSVGDLSACTSIGSQAFYNCTSLTSVGDLSACTSIGQYAFNNCSSLTSVGDLSACTSIGNNAFSDCAGLTSVGDLSACTSIGSSAFCGCSSLTSIGDLSACTSIGDQAFFRCSSLTSVSGLSACTSIGYSAFERCSSLTSINLSACTSIRWRSFSNCNSLICIDLSACTSIEDYAFDNCSSLTSIGNISVCTSIGYFAFKGVEKVTISNNTPPTLTSAPSDAGTTFIVPAAALDAYRAADYWADIKYQIIADNATTEYDVNAPLLDAIGASNLTNVMKLKVTGNIDSEDIMFIRNNMVNLHHLDLTDANYKASNKEYASGKKTADNSVGGLNGLLRLRSVKLPTSAKSIERDAFTECSYLMDIIIPEGVERIEDSRYYGATNTGAFGGCPFKSITLPNSLSYIGVNAFYNCTSLSTVSFGSNLKMISDYAFNKCSSLTTVSFSQNLKTIGSGAFSECPNLSSIILPTSLSSIGSYAFQSNYALTELRIPSSVESIGAQAFAACSKLKDIYTYVVDPIDINTNTFDNYTTAILHIPEQCENTYFRNPQWGQFLNKKTFNEPYTYFYASNDVVLNDDERFDAEVGEDIDFSGNAGSSITIEGDAPQPLGYMDLYFNGTKWASVMADENLTATHVRFHIPVTGNRWYFFSFPFRVYLNKVTSPGNYVFRCYDGAQRANNGNTGWKSLSGNTEYLEPGVGYIYQCNKTGELVIEVEAPDFDWNGTNKTNPLTAYAPSTGISDQHASWNFVGNPMTNYYDIDDMSYTSPLTIWNGSSYVAYRPGDDNYQLSPFEAFFVQKPVSGSDPTYTKDNRMSYNASQTRHNNKEAAAASRRAAENNKGRYLTNLVLSNGENEDQTRVVFNENTKKDYEMACDAAKFMSMEQVPQLFSVDTQTRFAINERPQGEVMLGFTAPKAGSYTLRAERMDMPMVVKDLVMGTIHELENGEYTFETEAGTFENRFVLMPASEATAISNAKTEGAEAEDVYTLDGKQLPTTAKGINIVRKGNEVQKVVTK